MPENQSVTILLVEDDPGHARLIEKNLRRAGLANPIVHMDDGQKAVDYLFGSAVQPPADATSLLVLLDLNLPVLDGSAVLARIKSDPRTRSIPVVMLTTSDNAAEVARCYSLGCNIYVTKPVDYDRFCEAVRSLGLLLSIVRIAEEGALPS